MSFSLHDSWVLIAAAGTGTRMNADTPKQFLQLAGAPVLQHTLQRCLSWSSELRVVLVTRLSDPALSTVAAADDSRVLLVEGGTSRAESVANGLAALSEHADQRSPVLVHDAARPLVRRRDVENLMITTARARAANQAQGGILATPVTDTIKLAHPVPLAGPGTDADFDHVNPEDRLLIERTLPRNLMWRAMTPQVFALGELKTALEGFSQPLPTASEQQVQRVKRVRRADRGKTGSGRETYQQLPPEEHTSITDEASAMERAGHRVLLVEGASDNIKITHSHDLDIATMLMNRQQLEP